MSDILLWLYLANAVLLINHEIDSAYWKEWELFKLPGGITGFLLLHIPMLFFILFGLVQVAKNDPSAFLYSYILSFGGIVAFSIHMYFLKKGRNEFNAPVSKVLLTAILIASIVQLGVTAYDAQYYYGSLCPTC